MKWTTEKPTEPGWYWFKNANGIVMQEIFLSKKGELWVDFDPLYEYENTQFAGPIPQPEN